MSFKYHNFHHQNFAIKWQFEISLFYSNVIPINPAYPCFFIVFNLGTTFNLLYNSNSFVNSFLNGIVK